MRRSKGSVSISETHQADPDLTTLTSSPPAPKLYKPPYPRASEMNNTPPSSPPSWELRLALLLEQLDTGLRRLGVNNVKLHWRLHQAQQDLIERHATKMGQPVSTPPPQLCPGCGLVAGAHNTRCPHCGVALTGVRAWLRGLTSTSNQVPGDETKALCWVIGLLYFLEVGLSLSEDGVEGIFFPNGFSTFVLGSFFGPPLLMGEYWRPITALFLHGNFLHIYFNASALMTIGYLIEKLYGRWHLWPLFVVTGITGWMGTWLWRMGATLPILPPTDPLATQLLDQSQAVHSIGASGAIFGLLGVVLAFTWRHGGPDTVPLRDVVNRWIGYGLIFGLVMPNVDNSAHVGGLVGGVLAGLLLGNSPRIHKKANHPWMVLHVVAMLLVGWSFLQVGLHFERFQ